MRISDWSSDVCSSDLRDTRHRDTGVTRGLDIVRRAGNPPAGDSTASQMNRSTGMPSAISHQIGVWSDAFGSPRGPLSTERKRVGEGKSGPVRVDSGRSRNCIKKKNNQQSNSKI